MGRVWHWVIAAGLALALSWPQASRADDLLTLPQFRERYVAALHKQDPDARVEVVAENELKITGKDGDSFTAFLDNAYGYYRMDPARLDAVLERYADMATNTAKVGDVVPGDLVVMVRPRSFLSVAEATPGKHGPKTADDLPVTHPFAGDLVVIVASDNPKSFSYPLLKDIRKAAGEPKAAWDLASAQTLKKVGSPTIDRVNDQIFTLTANPDFAADLLLDDRVWARPDIARLAPHPVVLVGRNGLVVVDADQAQAVATLRHFASTVETDPEFLSTQLFIRRNGGWSVLEPK